MLIVYACIDVCKGARLSCGTKQHTDKYLRNKDNPIVLFYPKTSSAYEQTDICAPITNSALRTQYPWITSNEDVEHIIDINNGPPELTRCNKRIRGNMIIANGLWNKQVGQLCWKDVSTEKRLVYGDEIYNFAYESVRSCCESIPNIGDVIGVIIAIVIALILLVASILVVNSYIRSNNSKVVCTE